MKIFFLLAALLSAAVAMGEGPAASIARWPRFGRLHFDGSECRIALQRGEGLPRLYVEAVIGSTRGLLLLDTGASISVLDGAVAKKEGFVARTAGLATSLSGRSRTAEGTVPVVQLGTLKIEDCAFIINDLTAFAAREKETQGKVIIGILGADILDGLGASIDLRENRLSLRKPNARADGNKP